MNAKKQALLPYIALVFRQLWLRRSSFHSAMNAKKQALLPYIALVFVTLQSCCEGGGKLVTVEKIPETKQT
jgi:hypothetical protein